MIHDSLSIDIADTDNITKKIEYSSNEQKLLNKGVKRGDFNRRSSVFKGGLGSKFYFFWTPDRYFMRGKFFKIELYINCS
jgi:hypothetical protein